MSSIPYIEWHDVLSTPTSLLGYGITDAVGSDHTAYGITQDNVQNWNNAYYRSLVTSSTEVTWDSIKNTPTTLAGYGITDDDSGSVSGTLIHNELSNLDYATSGHIGFQESLSFGIANTNSVLINAADVADNDYAKFTATGLEGRSYAEVLSDIGAAPLASPTFTGTVTVSGSRPITLSSGGIHQKGEAGGWAINYGFLGSSNTELGGFGVLGYNNDLDHYYIGDYGAERLTVLTGGSVGIGTTTPAYNLDIKTIVPPATDTYSSLQLQAANYGYVLSAGLKQGAGGILKIIGNNGGTLTERMRIDQAGNVGIGTNTPVSLFQLGVGSFGATHSGYNEFHAGAFGVLFRDNMDSYITGNCQYNAATGWVTKYAGYLPCMMAIQNGMFEWSTGTGTTAQGASSLSNKMTLSNSGNLSVSGTITGTSFIKSGGTSAQYLLADGGVTTSSGAVYKGTVNGTNGTASWGGTLADGTGTTGWYAACLTAGTYNYGSGDITLAVGDQLYYNGAVWLKIPGAGSYTLPVATGSVLGGVKSSASVSVDGSGVMSVSTAYDASGTTATHAALTTTAHGLGASAFHVDAYFLLSDGTVGLSGNWNAGGSTYTITAANFILGSDRRFKTSIKPIILKGIDIEYKQFELKSDPGQIRYGVIAQDLQKINPELVRTDKDGMLSVAYIDLLIKEVSYLKYKVAELERRFDNGSS